MSLFPEDAQVVEIAVDAGAPGEVLEIARFGLGQGGLSDEPMWEAHCDAVRALRPKLIRLFVQEYFNVNPAPGVTHWDTLDRSVDNILRTRATPLMSVCIKPKTLYPVIDQTVVHPTDYDAWEDLIFRMVQHANVERRCGIEYWEVFNEPNAGETGGCPSLFTAEDYCVYYEHTARAIRRADPAAKVGGPALLGFDAAFMKVFLDTCVARDVPVDFISWHGYQDDAEIMRQRMAESRRFLEDYPTLACENILDEWSISWRFEHTEPVYLSCFIVEMTYHMLEEGIDRGCYYHIRDVHVSRKQFETFMSVEGARNMAKWWNHGPQYGGLFDFQGVIRPAYFSFRMLSRLTGRRLAVEGASTGVRAIAARDDDLGLVNVLVWNYGFTPPAAGDVTLRIRDLPEARWELTRVVLDDETSGRLETDRMKLVARETLGNAAGAAHHFELPPYGVSLIAMKQL